LDASPEDDAGAAPHPVSTYCGDAIRDPMLEECDDGLDDLLSACTADCRVRDIGVLDADHGDAGVSPTFQRVLGAGVHVAAAQADGFAVAYVAREGTSEVHLAPFDRWGNRAGEPVIASQGGAPGTQASPVVAALPDGHYAVAWNDRASTPDVALRRITAAMLPGDAAPSGAPILVHASPTGAQQDADLLWTGSELVVAWTDGFDLKLRRFNAQLTPLAAEQTLAATPNLESSVSLAAFETGWAAAWRVGESGFERMRVRAGNTSWWTPLHAPGPEGDRPGLVQLDATHLLLVYTMGTDPLGSGTSNVGRLRYALLDVDAPGLVTPSSWTPLVEPYASDGSLAQRRPSLTRVGARVYLAWETQSPLGDPLRSEVFFAELGWSAEDSGDGPGELMQHEERPLQIDAPRAGDQRNARLAASPLFPEGAVITLWEDHSGLLDGRPAPDVLMAFRPSPLVTLDVEAGAH
jgi:hypothetical protein